MNILPLIPVAAAQYALPRQFLRRRPEPDEIMTKSESVSDFDSIMNTNIAISLCGFMQFIGEFRLQMSGELAVDLACGPGHFTLLLAKTLHFEKIIGIDLSHEMLDRAKKNARIAGLEHRVEFIHGDATDLTRFSSQSAALVTCTNSAHHLDDLSAVTRMMKEMDRISRNDGLAALMDLHRLKSQWQNSLYVSAMGREYKRDGLHTLFEDFRNSMNAAWTGRELFRACPTSSARTWSHFALKPLPINQYLYSIGSEMKMERRHAFRWKPPLDKVRLQEFKQYLDSQRRGLEDRVHQ